MIFFTDQDKIEQYLGRELTADEALWVSDAIENVTDWIKAYTGRNWGTTSEVTKKFDGNGKRDLFIEDFHDLTKIEFLDSFANVYYTLLDTDYELYPLNETIKDSIYSRLTIPNRRASVQVTAKFDSGELPAGVTAVATALVTLQLTDANTLTILKQSIEGASIEYKGAEESTKKVIDLARRLDQYKKIDV
jgi:hypothetical protein